MTEYLKNQSQDAAMINSLNLANDMITKGYLEKLEFGQIAALTAEDRDISLEIGARFFNLTKLVVNKKEKLIEQLTTVAGAAHATGGSMVNIIRSNGAKTELYIGVVSKENRGSDEQSKLKTAAALSAFGGSLYGNLLGSELTPVNTENFVAIQNDILQGAGTVCAVSGIPAFRDNEQDVLTYAQGIEHMIDSLRDQAYTVITIADPISNFEISQMRQGYELIYSQLATFLKTEVTLNETSSYSLSETETKSITDSISRGIALTQSKARSDGKFSSVNAGISAGISFIASASINLGISKGSNSSVSESRGETKNESRTSAIGTSSARSTSAGKTTGNSVQLSYENRTVKGLLEKIDKQLERLELCGSFGAFECASYIIADDRSTALSAASNFNAIIKGEDSSVQSSYINTWYKEAEVKQIKEYLKYFIHPKIYLGNSVPYAFNNKIIFNPASIMTGKEATLLMGLPRKSVLGLPVIEMVPFGRNVEQKGYSDKRVKLGRLFYMNRDEKADVELDLQSLASHTFITGSTGVGKSNAIYHILEEVNRAGVKFLVVEPAKGEYKNIFGNRKDVFVYGTNSYKTPILKINPFKFPADIHVLEHIERLIEIFNVCWPMYAAMPAVLKDAVERAYENAGWNLNDSSNRYSEGLFPEFSDVLAQLNEVINESQFSQEVKSNYIGALCTRVKSLTNGINGQIFVSDEIDSKVLFDSNTIVDLSRVASSETKAMIMGILIMRLQEYRISIGGMNRELQHVTVLEEAHHLLKRTSHEQSSESANLLGKSVEMLSNSIAEMRTFGEGFIIADQSPNMLDLSAIRNTNTKLILRLPDLADRQLAGHAAALNDEQVAELTKLHTGIAAVYQNNWAEPVLCHIDRVVTDEQEYGYLAEPEGSDKTLKSDIIKCLLAHAAKDKIDYDIENLSYRVIQSSMQVSAKVSVLHAFKYIKETNLETIIPAICGLININETLLNYEKAKNIDEWNKHIIENVDFPLMEMDIKYQDLVLFCIVSERYKDLDECGLNEWTKHMEGRLF